MTRLINGLRAPILFCGPRRNWVEPVGGEEDPSEIWINFAQSEVSGKVVLRQRMIKMLQLDKERGVLVTAQATGGWTLVPTSNLNYLQKQRVGKLLWGKGIAGADSGVKAEKHRK